MPIPDYQTLMLPVLSLAANREVRVPDVEETIANKFDLTLEEREQLLPSGRQRILHNRIHWAKFYLGKAGLLDSPRRGRFIASALGRELLSENPASIDVERLRRYPAFEAFYRPEATPDSGPHRREPTIDDAGTTTPEEQIESALQTLHNALRSELLARVLEADPGFFEGVIVDLLVAMGYGGNRRDAAKRLGRSGDGGVDGVIDEDRLGLDRIYVQAKRYAIATTVGRPDVQGFVGSLVGLGAHKGVFVTTSSFSQNAIEYAQRLTQRIILIDGYRLAELMIEHNVGVRSSRSIEVKRLDEDFFVDSD